MQANDLYFARSRAAKKNIVMSLSTSPTAFGKWLERHTGNSITAPGHYWLDVARQAYRTNGDLVWEIAARYVSHNPDKPNIPTLQPEVTAIQFEIIDLGNERIELTGKCLLDAAQVQREYLELLKEITKTWPNQQTTLAEASASNNPQGKRPITDPTDQRIFDMVSKGLKLTDQQIGQKINMSRQNVNRRRNKLEAMGYKVR
jgi:hypothetical protein